MDDDIVIRVGSEEVFVPEDYVLDPAWPEITAPIGFGWRHKHLYEDDATDSSMT